MSQEACHAIMATYLDEVLGQRRFDLIPGITADDVLQLALTATAERGFPDADAPISPSGGCIGECPFVGFQAGWLGYLSRVAAMGANTNLLVTYASWFWAPLDDDPWRAMALTVLIGSLTWLNVAGVKNSVTATYIFTVFKLIPLSLLILFGMGEIDVGVLMHGAELPEFGKLGDIILVLLYAYVGFEGTVVNAGERKSPRRLVPAAF